MIYFAQEQHSQLVKIGFSDDPWLRHSKMQADCPGLLTVLCLEEGDTSYERSLHERFATDRVRGEWFRFSDQIAEHVSRIGAPSREGAGLRGTALLVARYVDATGVGHSTARAWAQRGSVPTRHWAALDASGIATLAELAAAAAESAPRSGAA